MKRIISFTAIIILILSLSGCHNLTQINTNNASSEDYESTENYKELANKIFKLKDTIPIGSLQFTINSVRTSKGSEFIKPKAGDKYIYIDTTVENKGKVGASVSSLLTFRLVDKDGRNYNMAFVDDSKGNVDGSIGMGRKITGELVYEVPETLKNLQLEIDPDFGKGIAVVSIEVQ